ncbi:MAG: thioredoxin family protein [Pseudopedobacter saltans]|uniref:Thioredoxin family protein n=1 Tax=Pseudopedobacter saltans TaxID=151895 RepID=A0A2W5EXE1_9SPHI|nr:MAG: thioredoxin family protein [Pseudopedobacter saltans]
MIVSAQETKSIYDPKLDGMAQIKSAVDIAKKQHKNILLQIGGNWCTWCLAFNKLVTTNTTLDSILKADYVVEHINYSKENKNAAVMESLGFPNRFGFPVFVILDENGNRIHTQNSAYLEAADGKVSHDVNKVKEFLEAWSPKVLDPKVYREQLK